MTLEDEIMKLQTYKMFEGEDTVYVRRDDILEILEQEPKWIPVSERLPTGQTEVIVSIHDDSGDTPFDYTASGWVTDNGEYWIVDGEINYYVIAWMLLPEPYES